MACRLLSRPAAMGRIRRRLEEADTLRASRISPHSREVSVDSVSNLFENMVIVSVKSRFYIKQKI